MILIKNTQRIIKLPLKNLRAALKKMLISIKHEDFDLGVWFTTNRTIKRYNKRYRGKDAPTDILSFQHVETTGPLPNEKNLGDLIISIEYAFHDSPRWNHTFEEHLLFLLAHGIAHLLGYDHKTEKDFKIMHKIEKKILKATT